jgi:hypothetical protein
VSEQLRLRADALEWREIEGQVVVLDARKSTYLSVNLSGAPLWAELAKGTTKEALVDRLIDQFGLEPAQATNDVESFLRMLEEQELLEP